MVTWALAARVLGTSASTYWARACLWLIALITFVARQQLDNLLTHARQVSAQLGQDLGCNALAFADKTEQQELSTDVLVSHLQPLAQGKLKNLLCTWSKRNVAVVRLGSVSNNCFYLTTDVLERDSHGLQCLGSNTLTFLDEAEQDVLGTNVIVVEHPRFFLRQNYDATSTVRKPLEHDSYPLDVDYFYC